MKITFTASLRGKKYFESQYNAILNELKKFGNVKLTEDLSHSSDQVYTDLQKGNRDANVAIYKRKIEEIKDADVNIFECSAHSLAVGFMIQKALEYNKPTIVMYYKDNEPEFLGGIDDEKLLVISYDDDNIGSILKESLDTAVDIRDKRFNFFLSPPLLTYLENVSKHEGITKSTFLRKLILEHRKKTYKS